MTWKGLEHPPLYLSTQIDAGWQDDAACRPDRAPGLNWTPRCWPGVKAMAVLTEVCDRCVVRRNCAEWALHHRVQNGCYAGVWLPHIPKEPATASNPRMRAWLAAREQLTKIAYADTS